MSTFRRFYVDDDGQFVFADFLLGTGTHPYIIDEVGRLLNVDPFLITYALNRGFIASPTGLRQTSLVRLSDVINALIIIEGERDGRIW
jgi:hypothetical protein